MAESKSSADMIYGTRSNAGEFIRSTFGRQALPMVWDFCETFPLSSESGGFDGALDWVYRVLIHLATSGMNLGQVEEADACESPLPDETASVWFTDPPYYDAISYALLSDFFFVWLKRTLPGHSLLRDRFDIDKFRNTKSRNLIFDLTVKVCLFFHGKITSLWANPRENNNRYFQVTK